MDFGYDGFEDIIPDSTFGDYDDDEGIEEDDEVYD